MIPFPLLFSMETDTNPYDKTLYPENVAQVGFSVMDPDITEEREVYVFGWESFVADFGGYLGLLLGLSFLHLFDLVVDGSRHMTKRCL